METKELWQAWIKQNDLAGKDESKKVFDAINQQITSFLETDGINPEKILGEDGIALVKRELELNSLLTDNNEVVLDNPKLKAIHNFLNQDDTKLMAEFLIEKVADIDRTDSKGRTQLLHACTENKLDLVKFLIEHGADKDKTYYKGRTLLWYACATGKSEELVELLIDNGADIDKTYDSGRTQLWYACEDNNLDLVKLLIDHGADIQKKDTLGYTPLKRVYRNYTDLNDPGFAKSREPVVKLLVIKLLKNYIATCNESKAAGIEYDSNAAKLIGKASLGLFKTDKSSKAEAAKQLLKVITSEAETSTLTKYWSSYTMGKVLPKIYKICSNQELLRPVRPVPPVQQNHGHK